MTFSTSDGRGLLLQRFGEIVGALRSSLSSRVFSMAITAWRRSSCTSSICLSVNGSDLLR